MPLGVGRWLAIACAVACLASAVAEARAPNRDEPRALRKPRKKKRPRRTPVARDAGPAAPGEGAPAPAEEASPAPVEPSPADAPPPQQDRTYRGPASAWPFLGFASGGAAFGMGVRAGYTLNRRIYVGGTLVYHVGSSELGGNTGLSGQRITTDVSLFYPGAEGGYELRAGPLIVRPYGGIGVVFVFLATSGGGTADSSTNVGLALWPGVTAIYDIPESRFFVGGDARLVIATTGTAVSFGVFAGGGMHF